MNPLLQQLEPALLGRNPQLAKLLLPALSPEQIRKDLRRAKVEGKLDPLVDMYTWRDGTTLQGSGVDFKSALNAGFAPPVISPLTDSHRAELQRLSKDFGVPFDPNMKSYTAYNFLPLATAILKWKSLKGGSTLPEPFRARYFPLLWDGGVGQIAIDIDPAGSGAVVTINGRDPKILRHAYETFEDLLKDLIHANQTNEHLACVRTLGAPIEAPPDPNATPITKQIPATDHPLVIRASFIDNSGWDALCKMFQKPDDEFAPEVTFVSDPAFTDLKPEQLPALLPEDFPHPHAFIVDQITFMQTGHPILVVDLQSQPIRHFRVTTAAFADVANNLSAANLSFDDFTAAADPYGIFRGFPKT